LVSGFLGFIEAWEPPIRSGVHTYLLLGVFSRYRLIQPEVAHTYQVGDLKADIKETYRLTADDEPDLSIGFSD
jgi:hypothetical protein